MNGTTRPPDKPDSPEADLKRLNEQSERLLNPSPENRPDDSDRIEVLGRRIGRAIGYLIAGFLLWHLLTTYVL